MTDRWMVALLIVIAVAMGMAGQAWASWLDHKRRRQAMELIKAAYEAGREPPAELFAQIKEDESIAHNLTLSKRPWAEAVVFGAVGGGFWIAYGFAAPEKQTAFLIVASIMSLASLGCLALALLRGRDDKR